MCTGRVSASHHKYTNTTLLGGNSIIQLVKMSCGKRIAVYFTGPNEIYQTQITANKNYSYWMKDGVQNESWTQNEQHPRVNSEMTR